MPRSEEVPARAMTAADAPDLVWFALALLPLTILMLVLSGRSGELAARIGPRLQLSTGPLVVGAGIG